MFANRTRATKLATIAALVVFPLSITACGSTTETSGDSPSSTAPSSSAAAPSSAASSAAADMEAPFGPGCDAVPDTGAGSFDGMSKEPVATAASNNEDLSTLVSAVDAAGLVDTLNTADGITVFAPANSAFDKMDAKTLEAAMADPNGLLTDVLTAHVVSGRLTPADLAGEHDTLNEAQKVTVTGSGEEFTVNGTAKVVCGNVQTANATVYIIDGVLLPAM